MPVAPPLPPLAAAPVSAEARRAYVLRHFRLAYVGVPELKYAETALGLTVADGAGTFFQKTAPYPPAPVWRAWQGQLVPFFFDPQPEKALLELGPGTARINADIISAAFFLLSGWQEYFSDERDRHGRFPYAASVQKQYGFVALPVVNYYFDVLRVAIEHVTGQPLRPRPWQPAAPFVAFVSHDVDNLYSGWKAPAKAALRGGRWREFARRWWQHLRQPDAWDNLEAVAAATAQYGAKSTFFILPEHQPGPDGTPNADYAVSETLRQRLAALEAQGHVWELHGSIGTATDYDHLQRNFAAMRADVRGLRFHYLRWEPRTTPTVLEYHIAFDSTLGFAEHYGFRHSYCLPFYPFDFAAGQAARFLEIPLLVMDTTLHHPNYLKLTPAGILPTLRPVLAEVERFGGVFSLLWHNQNFDPANTTNGPAQFHEIMAELQQRGTLFLTGREILDRYPQPYSAPDVRWLY